MKKQELLAMGITELKALAKKAGIKAKTTKPAAKVSKKAKVTKAKAKKTAAPKKTEKKKEAKTKTTPKKPVKKKVKTTKKTAAKGVPKKALKKPSAKKVAKPAAKKAAKPAKKEIKKPLEELTIAELKTLAKELSIILKIGLKKADIIKAIGKAKVEKKPKPEKPKKVAAKKPAPKKVVKKAAPKPALKKEAKKKEKKVAVTKKAAKAEKPPKAFKKPPKALKELPEVLPKISEEKPKVFVSEELPTLPAEYGENKLASMPVTPSQIYVYWEITEDTITKYKGSLNLRIINSGTNAFFYLPLSERIGEHFINVTPAGEYTVEIGVINYKGEFVRILHSLPVETPVSGLAPKEISKPIVAGAGGLPEEFFETPESISSY